MRYVLVIAALLAIVTGTKMASSAMTDVAWSTSAAPRVESVQIGCPVAAEDDPGWIWSRCGNGARSVVTMWGTPKVVRCGDFRWLARNGDLDPRTPWLPGDWSCGRRPDQSILNY